MTTLFKNDVMPHFLHSGKVARLILLLFFLGTQLYAQSPGGVAPTAPNAIQFWIKADAGTSTTTNGASLQTWNDQSGVGRNVSQGTAGLRPTFYNTTNMLNFNPCVSFDGTEEMPFTNTSGLAVGSTARTVFAVATANTTPTTNQWIFSYGTQSNGQNFSIGQQANTNNPYNGMWGLTTFDAVQTTGTPFSAVPIIINGGYTTTAGGTIFVNSNQRNNTTVLNTATTTITGSGYIGRSAGGAITERWNGSVSEVIAFNGTLTANEIRQVETYLALKYGIALEQTTNYRTASLNDMWNFTTNAGYTSDVAGVGRYDLSGLNQKQSRSANTDDLVTIGLGSIDATNAANTNTFAGDGRFFVWGNNNAATNAWTTTDVPSACYKRIAREWKVQETGTIGNMKFSIPETGATTNLPTGLVGPMYLLVDDDGDFTAGATIVLMTKVGNNWEALQNLSTGQYFTFANSLTTSVISGSASTCSGGSTNISIALTGTSPWTFTYTDGTTPVTVTGTSTNPYIASVAPTGTKTYTVSALSSAGCTATQAGDRTGSAVITVASYANITTQPTPTTQTLCQSATPTNLTAAITGGTGTPSYQWYSNTINGYSGGISLGSGSGAQTLTYTPSTATIGTTYYYLLVTMSPSGCISTSNTAQVVVGGIIQPSAFTISSATVCQGQNNVTYTVPAVVGATAYTWTYGGVGATITGTTNSVTINYSSIATSGTLGVTATTSCGTSTARTMSVTVNPGIYLIPTTGLITYYKLNGNANDELVANQGTFQNAPTATTDRYGNANFAYNFNGSTQYVSSTTLYNNPTNFTVSIWFNTTTNTGGRLIGFGSNQTGGSGSFDRHVYMNDLGQIYFGVYPNAVRTINSPGVYNNGVWHMATASLSSTNGMKLYIDGVLVASDATTTAGQSYTGYWRLAYDNNGGWTSSPSSNFFTGSLDDALIYNTELTAAQISSIYSSTSSASSNSPVCNGGTLNLTAPTVSGASYSWTGPNGFSTSTQNPSVSAMSAVKEGAYVLTTTVSGCPVVSYAAGAINPQLGAGISQTPTSGLIGQYKLDGNANDVSGQYNNGTLQNAPTATTDRFGNTSSAYAFNGSNQFISTSILSTGLDNLTMSLWFNTTTTNGGKLIGFGDSKTGQSGNYDRHVYMNNAGQIYFGVYPNAIRTLNSTLAYNDGNWHMVTATLSSTAGMKLYVDGVLLGTDATTLNGQPYSGYFKIAYDNVSSWTSQPNSFFFNGSIDDVLIYNTALTATQITNLYNAPDGAGSNSAVCVNSTLNLTAPTVAGVTYAWTGPGGFSSSSQNPSFTFLPAKAGTYTLVATAASGCKTTAYALVAVNTTTPGLWTGSVSTSWQIANNWCGGAVPIATMDVLIPSVTNLPSNSATANAKNITINPSATLTNTPTGVLNVYGNLTNSGTFTDNSIYTSAGAVNFIGSTAQSITGATTFSNLTVNNAAGLTLNSATTVNSILTLTAGTLTTGGNLNQNLYTGAIAGTGTGSTSGNIRFFKTIWGDRYHYLSVPISGRTAADWNDNVTIKFGANSNLYTYNEALPDTNKKVGWTAVASTATSLQSFQGYALFFPRWTYNTLLDVSGTYNHGATFTSGTLNNTPSTTPSFKPASDGWQFMGNPYPSDIDWDAATGWTKTGINDAVYTWDGRTNKFVSYVGGVGTNGGTRYIGSMQGFFVKVTTSGGTGTLGLDNNVRVTSILHDVWRVINVDKIFRLHLSTDSINSDETVIRFTENATEQFDESLDAYKFINDSSVPSVFSLSTDADYSINSLPSTLSTKIIPLQVNAMKDGVHTWTADLSGFSSDESLYLEDRLLGTMQKLNDAPTYSQNLVKGEQKGRFFIHYDKKESIVTGNENSSNTKGIQISAINQNVFLLFADQNSGTADVSIFDALGKKIYSVENVSITSGRVDINLPQVNAGIYIVKAQTSTAARTQQVLIQK